MGDPRVPKGVVGVGAEVVVVVGEGGEAGVGIVTGGGVTLATVEARQDVDIAHDEASQDLTTRMIMRAGVDAVVVVVEVVQLLLQGPGAGLGVQLLGRVLVERIRDPAHAHPSHQQRTRSRTTMRTSEVALGHHAPAPGPEEEEGMKTLIREKTICLCYVTTTVLISLLLLIFGEIRDGVVVVVSFLERGSVSFLFSVLFLHISFFLSIISKMSLSFTFSLSFSLFPKE